MSSKRYRKRAGKPGRPPPARTSSIRLASKGPKPLWFYGVPFVVVVGFAVQHLVHEGLLDIVTYAASTDSSVAAWADQLRAEGFHVHVQTTPDPERIRRQLGVPHTLAACHTSITVQGHYVLEGDVPAENIKSLLISRPDIRGLAVLQDSTASSQNAQARPIVAISR